MRTCGFDIRTNLWTQDPMPRKETRLYQLRTRFLLSAGSSLAFPLLATGQSLPIEPVLMQSSQLSPIANSWQVDEHGNVYVSLEAEDGAELAQRLAVSSDGDGVSTTSDTRFQLPNSMFDQIFLYSAGVGGLVGGGFLGSLIYLSSTESAAPVTEDDLDDEESLPPISKTLPTIRRIPDTWSIDSYSMAFEPERSNHLMELDGKFYFKRDTGEGDEIWVTDLTASGPVIDLAGLNGLLPQGANPVSDIYLIGVTSSHLFFSASGHLFSLDASKSIEHLGNIGAAGLLSYGDGVLFVGSTSEHGQELWFSDGTAAGTAIVKDIRPGTEGSIEPYNGIDGDELAYTALANGKVIFIANDGTNGDEIWASDGTEAGTIRLTDGTDPYLYGEEIRQVQGLASKIIFSMDLHLWVTDGTPENTQLISGPYDDVEVYAQNQTHAYFVPTINTATSSEEQWHRLDKSTFDAQEIEINLPPTISDHGLLSDPYLGSHLDTDGNLFLKIGALGPTDPSLPDYIGVLHLNDESDEADILLFEDSSSSQVGFYVGFHIDKIDQKHLEKGVLVYKDTYNPTSGYYEFESFYFEPDSGRLIQLMEDAWIPFMFEGNFFASAGYDETTYGGELYVSDLQDDGMELFHDLNRGSSSSELEPMLRDSDFVIMSGFDDVFEGSSLWVIE